MISKSMYEILKHIPQSPTNIKFADLSHEKICDISFLKKRLLEAMSYEYIQFYNPALPHKCIDIEPFHLTEKGKVQVEEYERQDKISTRANLAIIISILSFIVAATALILKLFGVQ